MAVDIDRILLNQIPATFLRDQGEEVRDFWLYIMRVIWQIRNRTGGDEDVIGDVQIQVDDTLLSAMESRIAELESLVASLQRENDHLSRIAALESRLDWLDRETAIPKPEPQTDMDFTNTLIYDLLKRVESLEAQI